jgi:hypothetical protein
VWYRIAVVTLWISHGVQDDRTALREWEPTEPTWVYLTHPTLIAWECLKTLAAFAAPVGALRRIGHVRSCSDSGVLAVLPAVPFRGSIPVRVLESSCAA